MSDEMHIAWSSANLYATARNLSGQVWYIAGTAWETWGTGSRDADDYDVALTYKSGNEHVGSFSDFGITTAVLCKVNIHLRAGANPADTDKTIGYSDWFYWNGTREVKIIDIFIGDARIDTTTTPWQLVIQDNAANELFRKDLKDIDGNDLTSITSAIGRHVEP